MANFIFKMAKIGLFVGFLSRQISTKNSKNLINSANAALNSSRSQKLSFKKLSFNYFNCQILYKYSLSPCVRLFDATVLHFNSPAEPTRTVGRTAEPARTVGRTDRQIFYGRTGPDRRPLYNFDQRSLVSLSVSGQSVCDGGYQG